MHIIGPVCKGKSCKDSEVKWHVLSNLQDMFRYSSVVPLVISVLQYKNDFQDLT